MDTLFVIRHAVVSDAHDIHAVLQDAFKEYAKIAGITELDALKETISDIEREIINKTVYVAIIDGIIIGTIRVEITGDEAYISRFAVKSSHRKMGVGESLMNLVDMYLKAKGIKKAFLFTAFNNTNLVRFYHNRGFYIESVSTERGYPRAKMVKDYSDTDLKLQPLMSSNKLVP